MTLRPSRPAQPLSVKTLIGDAVDNPESQQYKNVAAAIETFRKRDFDGARDLLTEARTAQPKLPPVEVIMAKLFAVGNLAPQARNELEQAVRRHPTDPEPYLMFGDASIVERRITDAAALYEKADKLVQGYDENTIRKENFQKRVLNGLALVAEARQQWEEMEGLLRQYLKMDAKNASVHQRLGRALFQQATPSNKKYADAYNAFVAAIKADENAVSPDVAMGQLFEMSAQDALRAKDDAKFKDHRKQATSSFSRDQRGKRRSEIVLGGRDLGDSDQSAQGGSELRRSGDEEGSKERGGEARAGIGSAVFRRLEDGRTAPE